MNEQEILKKFAKWLDDQLDFKKLVGGVPGTVIEMVDGHVFSIGFNAAFQKVPEEHKGDVLSVLVSIMSGDYKGLSKEAVDIAVVRIKTPLGDAKEKIILGGIVDIVFGVIGDSLAKNGDPGQGPPDKDPK